MIGSGQCLGRSLVVGAALGDEVLEHREEQLILAAEDPVEGLQRDAGLLDQLLRGEVTAFGDEPARGGDDRVRLLDLPRA